VSPLDTDPLAYSNTIHAEEYNAAKHVQLDIPVQESHFTPHQNVIVLPRHHRSQLGASKKGYKLIDVDEYEGELNEGSYIKESQSVIRIQDEKKYKQRFAHFSEFYQSIKGEPYPLEYDQQEILHHFPEQTSSSWR
jgi:hypothetical protein